ncbi:tail fiber assembly protein [Ralstonia phage RSB3]|uniref:Tail fiber assembly protein n=1 Tax=Ralstonia phage RSB3 TaxID=1402875 RepID=U3TK13_9CAUD|nr:tail fiber assembly protein [Ralstonia phage RSB3]BAN92355.1 hypothetical protein [Ralstonia phage RSB3]
MTMDYMANNDLMALLMHKYPDLKPGTHYVLVCAIPNEGFSLQEHARIHLWNNDYPQPSQEELVAYWVANQSEILLVALADETRGERNRRLTVADQLVEKAIDKNDPVAERAARDYRQALRDLTNQPGFPETVVWPEIPA